MLEFFHDCCAYPVVANSVYAVLLASVACGVVGTLSVARRATYVAGAVSHSALAGIGFARYAGAMLGWAWLTPGIGAMLAAVVSALAVVLATFGARQRSDTALSAIWVVGMAAGLAFMSATPGYQSDLMGYLFGSVSTVTASDLRMMAALDAICVIAVALGYRGLLAVCFNRDLARIRGVRVALFEVVFAILVAIAVVLLVRVVGIVLAIALLSLPSATAGLFERQIAPMMAASAIICAAISVLGLAISYSPNWRPGVVITLLAGGSYLAALILRRALRRR